MSSRGMSNAPKTNILKQNNQEKATAMDNDLANGY